MADQEFRIWCGFRIFWVLVALIFVLAGCAGGPLTTREGGLLGGAGLGAVTGAIIGGASGHPGAGAAIGGVVGGIAGGVIGDQLQGREDSQQNKFNPQDLVGLREEDAMSKIKSVGFTARVLRRDNQRFVGTTDYRTDRVILEIDNGIVTKAYIS